MNKVSIRRKQKARKLLVQAIYQWIMSRSESVEILAQFHTMNNMSTVDTVHFDNALKMIIKDFDNFNKLISQHLDRNISELNPVEHAVLLLGTYELEYCIETPYRIILDETITLTKTFGSQDGHKYINGVLHNIAKSFRLNEN